MVEVDALLDRKTENAEAGYEDSGFGLQWGLASMHTVAPHSSTQGNRNIVGESERLCRRSHARRVAFS